MDQRLRSSELVPPGFKVDRVTMEGNEIVITIRHRSMVGICPCCGRASRRVHSRYCRRVADLPLSGRRVRLVVAARRFRCDAVLCRRRIFAERFGDAVLAPSLQDGRPDSISWSTISGWRWEADLRQALRDG